MTRAILGAVLVACLVLALGAADARSRSGATVSRSCLTWQTLSILEAAEAHFGVTFRLVSTCRPGAVIAGTRHASQHRYGKAVDLMVPAGVSKRAVVRWFYEHAPGVPMVYRSMAHVHFDTGPYHKLASGGCGGSAGRGWRTRDDAPQ